MINLRFGARALPLNPIVHRKADRVDRCRTTFSPSAVNSPENGYFRGGSSRIQKDFLAPDLYLNCFVFFVSFFYTIKDIVINPVNSNTAVQSPYFLVEELCLSKTLYLRGKTCKLAVLTFNNSPRTRLVALKCGSVLELVISVTLNNIRQTTANVSVRL